MPKSKSKSSKKPKTKLPVNQKKFIISLANPYIFKNFDFDHETLGFIFKGLVLSKSKSSLEHFFNNFQSSSEYFSSITKEPENSSNKFEYVKDLFFLMFRDDSYADILSFLLKQNSVMEMLQYNNLGNLCLLESCIYGAVNNTELLLEEKFDPNYKTPGGRNAVHLAAQSKNVDVLTKVLKHIKPGTHDLPDNQGFTPFALAVAANNMPHKKLLEKLKVNHQATLKIGNTQFTMSISDISKKLSISQLDLSLPRLSSTEQQLAKFAFTLLSAHDGLLMIGDIFDGPKGLATINAYLEQSINHLSQYLSNSNKKTDTPYLEFRPTDLHHTIVSLSTFCALSVTSDTATSLACALAAQPSLLAQFFVNNIKNFLILFNIDEVNLYNDLFNKISKNNWNALTLENKLKITFAFKLAELYYDPENAVTALDNQPILSCMHSLFGIDFIYAAVTAYLRLGEVEKARSMAQKDKNLSEYFLPLVETYNNEWSQEQMTQYIGKSTKQATPSSQDKSEVTASEHKLSSKEYEVLGLIESFSQQNKANILFHQGKFDIAFKAYHKGTGFYPLAQYLNLEKMFAIICLSGDKEQGLDILQKLYKQKPGLESSLNTPEFVYYEFLFHEWNDLEEKATVFLNRLKKNPGTAYKNHYITEAIKVRVSTLVTSKKYDDAEKEMTALKGILSDEDFASALQEFHASTDALMGVKVVTKAPTSKAKIEKVEYIKEDSTESKHYNISLAIQANDLVYLSKVTPTDMHGYHQNYKNSLFVRDIGSTKLRTSWLHANQKFFSNDGEIVELPGGNKEYVLVANNVFRKLDTLQQKGLDSAVKTGVATRSHGADGIIRNKGFFEIKSLHKGLRDVRAYADTVLKNPAGYVLYIVDKVGNHKDVKKHAAVKHIECAFAHDHEIITSSISELSLLENNNNTTLSLSGEPTELFYDMELNG